MRILLVEDDPALGDGLAVGLRQMGYAVDWLQDGVRAEAALATTPYDVVVLDLGLPRMGGHELLRRIRKKGISVPVLILTARDALADKVAGLDEGADDYVVKPVDLEELAARIRALTRRAVGRADPVIRYRELAIDPAARTVTLSGRPVSLTANEFALLLLLVEQQGRVVSRAKIESSLYSWSDEPSSNTVEVYIHHLRKKLGGDLIKTVRGVGYLVPK